jgi:hypothetical protein
MKSQVFESAIPQLIAPEKWSEYQSWNEENKTLINNKKCWVKLAKLYSKARDIVGSEFRVRVGDFTAE